ncbi:zinc ribbon domain-containing protein [Candidatus Thorarchaeota archaeon]|nr:MAG: zinc ribbon domain-containing protein [Candidatus Thorarchaeota archaeon]
MRVCSNCGKANQPTRKFCIRCGRKLIPDVDISPKPPKEPARDTGTVTTQASMKAQREREETKPSEEEQDQYVRPSEVAKDRVRTTVKKGRMTEMEKAQLAFKKAESAGIEEAPSGIVESRMLRPSEVHELLEGPTQMETTTPSDADLTGISPENDMPTETAVGAPRSDELEEQLLGSHSAYVKKEEPPEAVLTASTMEEGEIPPEVSGDFTSSKYAEAESKKPAAETTEEELVWEEEPRSEDEIERPSETTEAQLMVSVTHCPNCGELINVDTFEYPPEVYSAMGKARIKQARFFIVQGKYDKAQKIVRIAHALLTKAQDEAALKEVRKVIDSLASKS